MSHFEVDPDSLTAAAEVARRQGQHVADTSGYISGVCSRFGAFSGVLSLFLGNYQETVATALDGMRDSRTVADTAQRCFTESREAYLDSDRSAHTVFERLFGDEISLAPYVAPGSGATTPGGPQCPAGGRPPAEDDDPFKLQKLPPWLDEPTNRVIPGDTNNLPAWMDPKGAAKDAVVGGIRHEIIEQRYLDARAQGLTPEQAHSAATMSVDSEADRRVYDTMADRSQAAHDTARYYALGDGASPEDARRAGDEAAAAQHHEDAVDHQNRRDILGAAGTYKGAYDTVSGTVDKVNGLVEGGQQLHDTLGDINDYDDYENRPEDTSAQEWASR